VTPTEHYPLAVAAVTACVTVAREGEPPAIDDLALARELVDAGPDAVFTLVMLTSRLLHTFAEEVDHEPLEIWRNIALGLAEETQR
jgi:hypothetical protein